MKDRYNVNVDGELNVRAYKKEEVPVTKLEDSRGHRMLLTNGIIDFFSRHWPYITGGLILVFIVIFIRAAKSHNYEDDYFYEEPPFQYNQWGLEEGQPRINLAQKLERMGAKPYRMFTIIQTCMITGILRTQETTADTIKTINLP